MASEKTIDRAAIRAASEIKMIAGAEMEAYIAGILAALFFILSEISELKYEL